LIIEIRPYVRIRGTAHFASALGGLGMISKLSFAGGLAAAIALIALIAEPAQARTSAQALRYVGAIAQLPSAAAPEGVDFTENFDSYTAGDNVHGQGGWKGWANDPNAGALVDDTHSVSPSNAIAIEGPSDLIHEFSGYTSGAWVVTAKMFIPSDFAGETYFIFENVYSDVDQSIISWSTQVVFRSASGTVENFDGSADPGSMPYVTDEWADLRLEIDLDADLQTFYYNGVVLYSGSWTQQFPGQTVPGSLNIGSIDLFASGSTTVYYDDIALVPLAAYAFTLDAATTEGSGPPGSTVTYTLTISNTGTQQDTYDISAIGMNWTATPSATTVTVDAGQSATFDVAVDVPDTVAIGSLDTAAVTVTSEGDPGTTADLTLTTTAALPDEIFSDGFENPL